MGQKKLNRKRKATRKAIAAVPPAKQFAFSIYEPINGHSVGGGALSHCKSEVRKVYPNVEFVEEESGRILGQVQGGNVATIAPL